LCLSGVEVGQSVDLSVYRTIVMVGVVCLKPSTPKVHVLGTQLSMVRC